MAQATFRHGEPLMVDYTPAGAVAGGDVVVIGTTPFVCHTPIAAGDLGAMAALGGVYRLAKPVGAITGGAIVYWDDTNNQGTTTSSGNTKFGYAVPGGALSADTTVDVVHNPN